MDKKCCEEKDNLTARTRGTSELITYCKKCGTVKKSYEIKRR